MGAPHAEPAAVSVLGAGPVGCAAALLLRSAGFRVAVHDDTPVREGFRPIALSYASRLILERIGAWGRFDATPIESVHVSQQGGFGRTVMQSVDAGVPALGYVADYGALTAALRALAGMSFTGELPGTTAALTVHAEGIADDAKEKRYDQDAVVARVAIAPPAGTTAHERFTSEGPLALLPFAGAFALVWSARPERARTLAALPDAQFLEALAAAAGRRLGRPTAVSNRAVHPLVLRVRREPVAARAVYIGNAAQSLHPVAGQGLNLGLRDAWDLARILRDAHDPGDPAALARYRAARRADAFATVRATDFLAGAFTGRSAVVRAARGLALSALDVLPGPRRFFARRMMFGPSALP
jgi:2-octaprenyl-6-methoxyphenol hydroxylase